MTFHLLSSMSYYLYDNEPLMTLLVVTMPKHIPDTPDLSLPSDVAFVLDPSQPVLAHGRDMKAEATIGPHSHPRGQLLWAEKGVLRITSEEAVWLIPTTHAIWIPSNICHQVNSETDTQIRNLYVDPHYPIREQEKSIVMLTMSSLMREITLRLNDKKQDLKNQQSKHLGLVAIDELQQLAAFNNYIHSGDDPRLQRLISYLVQHPKQTISLPDLANIVGASVRTLERLFKSETGMTYRQWRSRFRLMNALVRLTPNKSSTSLAHELGYKSASSFINAFKMQFGCTPQQYISRNHH